MGASFLDILACAVDPAAFDPACQIGGTEAEWEMRRRGVLQRLRVGLRIAQANGYRVVNPVDGGGLSAAELDACCERACENLKDAADLQERP